MTIKTSCGIQYYYVDTTIRHTITLLNSCVSGCVFSLSSNWRIFVNNTSSCYCSLYCSYCFTAHVTGGVFSTASITALAFIAWELGSTPGLRSNYNDCRQENTSSYIEHSPPGTRRCCDVESTSLTVIQRRNNAMCPAGSPLVSIVGLEGEWRHFYLYWAIPAVISIAWICLFQTSSLLWSMMYVLFQKKTI